MIRQRAIAMGVVAALALSLVPATASAASYDARRIDPALLSQVLRDPTSEYDVIVRSVPRPSVRRDDRAKRAGDEVTAAGGRPKFSLGIVGGAAARIQGRRLLGLTNSARIDYVYADARLAAQWDTASGASAVTTPGIVSINAPAAWATYGVSGLGVGVAIVDSGIYAHPDLGSRLVAAIDFADAYTTTTNTDPISGQTTTTTTYTAPVVSTTPLGDPGGHGTHVAGLVAGNGTSSAGAYTGVAPRANLVDVRVIRGDGSSNVGVVLRGLQWILNNRIAYNIKVVNLSLGGPVNASYKLDPLATATEVLTFAGITVVVAAGNDGSGAATITTPANDPYVISVGAVDDAQTVTTADDTIATFSSRGATAIDGLTKPDVAAPGRRMVSLRSPGSSIDGMYPERRVFGTDTTSAAYLRMSGTSMAAPVVAGTVALMLERNPGLRPAQVKKTLKSTARPLNAFGKLDQGAGTIDVAAAVGKIDPTREYAEGRVSNAFAKDMRTYIQGQPLTWKDPTYHAGVDSKNVPWTNVTWENITWDDITWENLSWEDLTWENLTWENLTWEDITWESTSTLGFDPLGGGTAWTLLD